MQGTGQLSLKLKLNKMIAQSSGQKDELIIRYQK